MSLPAREAERWAPVGSPTRRAVTPARPPAARPSIPNPSHPHRRPRRGHPSAFGLLTAAIVSALVVGLVSLNAMRVDTAYRTRSVAERVRLLTDERRILVNDVARLSSPSRIGTWARRTGLVPPAPGEVVILQIPSAGTSG
jgi:ferric-dicitrate binding protein FerR (iron transport regulator)